MRDDPQAELRAAAAALDAGRPAEAEALCARLLAEQPDHAEALNLLATIRYQQKKLTEAEALVRRALAQEARVTFLYTLGLILRAAGRPAEAARCYRQILTVMPDNLAALGNLANALGDLDDAAGMLDVLQQMRAAGAPEDTLVTRLTAARAALRNLAVTQHKQGQLAEADALYQKLLAETPEQADLLALRAVLQLSLGQTDVAETLARQAVAGARTLETLAALAHALQAQARHGEAVPLFREALALAPDTVGLLLPLANSLLDLGQLDAAHQAARAAYRARPDFSPTAVTLSAVYQVAGRLEEAAEVLAATPFQEPPALDGQLAASLSVFGQLGRLDQRPALTARLQAALEAPETVPLDSATGFRLAFLTQFYGCSDAQKWKLLRQMARTIDPQPRPAPAPRRAADGRLRIGYFSPNFGEHPVSHLLAPLLEAHDRARFAVHAYSISDHRAAPQDYPRRMQAATEFWRDCPGLSDPELVARLRADGIDVLIDLGGYQSGSRPRVLAARPAAVQIHWIMQLGGMPAPFIDYSLVDKVMVPGAPDDAQHGALIRMPHAFQPGYRQPVATELPSRPALGLPATGPVLCAFNNPLKIDPEAFAAWMEILRRVPAAVLWLSGKGCAAGLRAAATTAGVAPERLVFSPRLDDRALHLGRHRLCDLYLDTFTFNGATSCMDALLAGLPPLTRAGDQAYGRIGASFLTALGVPELIAPSTEAYIDRAVALLTDAPRRAALQKKLTAAVATGPLFDAALFTRQLESALEEVWRRALGGQAPASFDVPAEGVVPAPLAL